jgi:hypothetical protein
MACDWTVISPVVELTNASKFSLFTGLTHVTGQLGALEAF